MTSIGSIFNEDFMYDINGMKFEIDPEFSELLPSRTPQEFELLRELILASEHFDPLVILCFDGRRILGDGHARFSIAEGEGLLEKLNFREVEVADRQAAIDWMRTWQLARRNLTDQQRAYCLGKLYESRKQKKPFESVSGTPLECHSGTPVNTLENKVKTLHQESGEILDSRKIAQVIAKEHGTSERSVYRAAEYARAVDELPESIRKDIMGGKSGLTNKQIREAAKAKRRERQAKGNKPSGQVDMFGRAIPAKAVGYDDDEIKKAIDLFEKCSEKLRFARVFDAFGHSPKNHPFIDTEYARDMASLAVAYLDSVAKYLNNFRSQCVCPECSGKGCAVCQFGGMTPVVEWGKNMRVPAKPCPFCSGRSIAAEWLHDSKHCEACEDRGVIAIDNELGA